MMKLITLHSENRANLLFNLLDATRIFLVVITFFIGYLIGYRDEIYNPVAQLHFMVPLVIFAVAGLSGLEALIWPDRSAAVKGYEKGSNYQRQSALAMVSLAVTAIVVWLLDWGLKAELTILFAFLLMFFLSAVNHVVDAIQRRNYAWQNINRPFILLFLMAGLVYPVMMALKI